MYNFLGNYCNCLECNKTIGEKINNYSVENYGISLCINCQNWLKEQQNKSTYYAIRLYFELKYRKIPAELEKFDGYKHIDIAIPKAKINIEVDGTHHNYDSKQALADLKRTFHSFNKGYYTIRIPNSLTKDDYTLNQTANYLADMIHTILKNNKYNNSYY